MEFLVLLAHAAVGYAMSEFEFRETGDSLDQPRDAEGKLVEARLGRVPRMLARSVFLLSSAIFVLWVVDATAVPALWALDRSNVPAGFTLAALSLWLQGKTDGKLTERERLLSSTASAFVFLLGALTLFEYIAHLNIGIDDLFFADHLTQNEEFPGRMSPNAAVAFIFLGIGSFVLCVPDWGRTVGRWLFVPAMAVSFFGFVGHLQGATFLYRVGSLPGMSWLCALGFMVILAGHFFCRGVTSGVIPTIAKASPAGMVVRRLVFATLTLPVFLSWATGLVVRRGYVPAELGLALLASVLVITLTWYAFKTARLLDSSEQRFKTLFQRMSVGMAELDVRAQKFISANLKFQQMTGYTLEELRELSPFDLTHPDDLPPYDSNIHQLYNGDRPTYRAEKRYVRKDGSIIWIRVDAAVIRWDKKGTPLSTVGICVDITEEKEVALALERSEKALRNAVQASDQFTSIASHELKTPLTNLLLRAQLAKRGVFADPSNPNRMENIPEFLEHIESQVLRLNKLVDEMLDVARIRCGKLSLKRERFDMNEAVQAVVGRLHPLLTEAAGGRPPLIVYCKPTLGNWDRVRIEQVLTNLLSNVVRYGRGLPAKILVEECSGGVRLSVQDSGPGIPPEVLERIFCRYVTGAGSSKLGGLGLGLFLSRKILEAHGGTIRAESEIGVGTTFIVELPLAERGVDSIEVA